MLLVASGDLREPDLARIENPFFACSKIRRLYFNRSSLGQHSVLSNLVRQSARFDDQQSRELLSNLEKLLHDIEEGRQFLVIESGLAPLKPVVHWQPDACSRNEGQWIVEQSLGPSARLNLERAIAHIDSDKTRRYLAADHASIKSSIIPIDGNAWAGMLKRYANLSGNAFPRHLTAADEKDIGFRTRSLYGGNDAIRNQADINAYNNRQSAIGVTHGQIFDAMDNAASVLSLFEGGWRALSRLRGTKAGTVSSRLSKQQNTVNGGSVKSESRRYLSEIETSRISNQQSGYTCGPACGVAELRKHGIDTSEAELADLAGTRNTYGTDPTRLAEALNKKLPPDTEIRYRGGYLDNNANNPEKVFDELTAKGQWIMQTNSGHYHFIVIDTIDDGIVTVLDPWRLDKPAPGNGLEATIARDTLLEHWMKGDFGFIYPANVKQR
jgi:hypothetical protein